MLPAAHPISNYSLSLLKIGTRTRVHAAQRDSIENKQGKRALGGVRQRVLPPLIIESGSLNVALSPEEIAGGVAGSVTSTVYDAMAIKL